jgi:ribosome-associated translation inhibitor RaiA
MEIEMVNFNIFDPITRQQIKDRAQPLFDKFEKFFGKDSLFKFKLDLKKTHEDPEGKSYYEVKGYLETKIGPFRTIENGWEILTITDKIIQELTRMITEQKEKIKTKRKLPANV